MKRILFALSLVSLTCMANELPPKYMQDGKIVTTLKDGKKHEFSTNEYAVVKRGAKRQPIKCEPQPCTERKCEVVECPTIVENPKRLKHIVSGELLHSYSDLESTGNGNRVDVENRKKLGVGLQYQYNIHKDVYMGGRVDTNGGTGLSLGLGF